MTSSDTQASRAVPTVTQQTPTVNNANNRKSKSETVINIFNGKRPHCWCYVKEANETHFSMYLCILWNNLILFLFSDESAATHFFSSKMDSTNKMQRFIDLR